MNTSEIIKEWKKYRKNRTGDTFTKEPDSLFWADVQDAFLMGVMVGIWDNGKNKLTSDNDNDIIKEQ